MGGVKGSPSHRPIGSFDLQAMPGYRVLDPLTVGWMLDYHFVSQLNNNTAPGSDFTGNGLQMGLGVMFEPGPLKLLVSYDPWSRHWHSNPDTTFKGSGYHLLAGYKVIDDFSFDLEYVRAAYNVKEILSLETPLGPDEIFYWSLAFGISYTY